MSKTTTFRGMRVHPPAPVPKVQKYGFAAHPVTNFPSIKRIKEALAPGQGKKKRRGKPSRRRTSAEIMEVAKRDATSWHERIQAGSPFRTSRSAPPPPPHGGGAGGGGGHRQAPFTGYRIAPLTKTEYATLVWLSERGYDAGILKTAGIEKELFDGTVVLGSIPEHKAWEIKENYDQDPNAFLTSCGSEGLKEKLYAFMDRIV